MKARVLRGLFLLMLGGCASVEMAQYTVTSFAEVPLKEHAKVKIVTNNDDLNSLARAIGDDFNKSGSFKVVDSEADYWFVLSGKSDYINSAPQKKITVVKNETESGGSETFAETIQNLDSAAIGVSVAVYDVKTLAPVHYFEIPIYDGGNSGKAVVGKGVYEAEFAKNVVERMKDAFITQQKQVETPVPLEANSDLRKLFLKGGEGFAKGDASAYRPFLEKYKSLGQVNLRKLHEQLRSKTYEGEYANMKLGNYYLFLLVKEAITLDPEKLAAIRDEQLLILESSDAKGLAEAVPVALARLEYKLANLGE